MMQMPLTTSTLIEHTAILHGAAGFVTRGTEGAIRRTTYARMRDRSKQIANVLSALGVRFSGRLGILAWSTDRRFKLYFGVSGPWAVLHTINPLLHPEQITYMVKNDKIKRVYLLSKATRLASISAALRCRDAGSSACRCKNCQNGADSAITGNGGADLALLIKAAKGADLQANFYT